MRDKKIAFNGNWTIDKQSIREFLKLVLLPYEIVISEK